MSEQELKQWINQNPPPEEISKNADGSEFLDISVVEQLLDLGFPNWGTTNFKFRIIELSGTPFASASIELLLTNNRRLVGAATLPVAGEDLAHVEPVMASECIKNSCKRIGKRFGRDLNDRGKQSVNNAPVRKQKEKRPAVKMKPDADIMKKYAAAIAINDTATIEKLLSAYQIKTQEDYA